MKRCQNYKYVYCIMPAFLESIKGIHCHCNMKGILDEVIPRRSSIYLPTYSHTLKCISVKYLFCHNSSLLIWTCSLDFTFGSHSFLFTLFNTRNTQIYANSMWRKMKSGMNWKKKTPYCNQFACVLPVGLSHFPCIYKLIQCTLL